MGEIRCAVHGCRERHGTVQEALEHGLKVAEAGGLDPIGHQVLRELGYQLLAELRREAVDLAFPVPGDGFDLGGFDLGEERRSPRLAREQAVSALLQWWIDHRHAPPSEALASELLGIVERHLAEAGWQASAWLTPPGRAREQPPG